MPFVLKAWEIIWFWTKCAWNYSLVSLVTIRLPIRISLSQNWDCPCLTACLKTYQVNRALEFHVSDLIHQIFYRVLRSSLFVSWSTKHRVKLFLTTSCDNTLWKLMATTSTNEIKALVIFNGSPSCHASKVIFEEGW